jgi:hypothetical protein
MSYGNVEIVMFSGEKHYAAGYASRVAEQVNEARRNGDTLIAIERDLIPTGQMMHLDPRQIESIKDR